VDLSKKEVTTQPLSADLKRNYMGGRGFNARIFFNEVSPKTGPFDPDNMVMLSSGPLTGASSWGARTSVGGKSPLNGRYGDASGREFGATLKFAGYDTIVVKGKAEKPVYIWIDDDKVEIRDAAHLWGKNVQECHTILKESHGDPLIETACIGPAGENQCYFAHVILSRFGNASKCGLGCAMGSKNLKAIAVRGTKGIKIARPEELKKVVARAIHNIDKHPVSPKWARFGTGGGPGGYNKWAQHAVRNWRQFTVTTPLFTDVNNYEKLYRKGLSCHYCALHCDRWVSVEEGPYRGTAWTGPEFLIHVSSAWLPDVKDGGYEYTQYCNYLMTNLGIDGSEFGALIGWAMECWERGILTEKDTDGIIYEWGNKDAVIETIKRASYRTGKWGELISNGLAHAAREIGRGSEKYAMTIKDTGFEGFDVRACPSWELALAVAPRGACHTTAEALNKHHTPWNPQIYSDMSDGYMPPLDVFSADEGVAKIVKWSEDWSYVFDSAGICKFFMAQGGYEKEDYGLWPDLVRQALAAATGMDWTVQDMLDAGARAYVLMKVMNVEAGLTRADDCVPERIMKEPVLEGPGKGMKAEDYHDKNLDAYYIARGWEVKTGFPTRESLGALGLKDAAARLAKIGRLGQSAGDTAPERKAIKARSA